MVRLVVSPEARQRLEEGALVNKPHRIRSPTYSTVTYWLGK